MKSSYAHLVIGAGALGCAAAYRLAKAGATDVLVLEQFELGHTKGASEDHSRIIRHAYHARPYTALTHAMFASWAEVEEETGLQLYVKTGGLELARVGTTGAEELANYRGTLAAGVRSEDLDAVAIRERWPQWRIGEDGIGLYQEDGGIRGKRPAYTSQEAGGIQQTRRATASHIALARRLGVEFLEGTKALRIDDTDSHVTVT